jgi:DNA-binding GntR family transcriptional regulator
MDRLLASAEQEAYDYVLQRIRNGAFRAGDRLIAEDIAVAISASRMPVRVAFRRLATEGLLLIRPNRGATVRGITVAEMREVFEMRAVLEAQAVRVALPHLGAQELRDVENLLDRMDRHGADVQQWVTHHRNLHEYLCGLSQRPRLIAQIAALHSFVEPHMRLWMEHTAKPNSTEHDHHALLHALRRGDPDEVEEAMREHIVSTIPPLERLMADGVPLPAAASRQP